MKEFTLKGCPGWTLNENSTATWTKQLESKVCAMVVAPVVPEVSMEECTEANQGATVWETVSLPTTEGVTYTQETSASCGDSDCHRW